MNSRSSTSEDGSKKSRRKRHKKSLGLSMNRIHPDGSSGELLVKQNGYEMMGSMQVVRDEQDHNEKITKAADAFSVLQTVQEGADRFKGFNCRKRIYGTDANSRGCGIDDSIIAEPLQTNHFNGMLISYFAKMARSSNEEDVLDIDHIEYLLDVGADIRCTDRFGQSVLHEAVRAWEIDVATFLLEKGAKPNQSDQYGRAPLHIAAAVNYPEMIALLLDNDYEQADIEILTDGENQTPLHFAARNDANESLRLLIKRGANLHARDYKGRTPLQLAAELDRSETAKVLLELGANASDRDLSGQTALVLLISKMPAVAKEALDQFHRLDGANRKQYYDHHLVEQLRPGDKTRPSSRSALQVIVKYNQLQLILHPVIQRLLEIKWNKFGRFGAIIQCVINLSFILLWTAIAITIPSTARLTFPKDLWLVILWALALFITAYLIIVELQEIYQSKKKFKKWNAWRISQIEMDLKYCHPQWPQEEHYLRQEIDEINDQRPAYFSEFWNYFDWIVYFLLLVITGLAAAGLFSQNDAIHLGLLGFVRRFMAVTIIFIWLRFMKTARAFKEIGPFIVMLGHITGDIVRFGFLYLEFYIPYACAFWMIFGANPLIPSMLTVDSLLFTLFRITLVDDYDYEGMHAVDAVMAYILLTSFLFLSALLCINLFIALLSDTFQRVYDNANSNAAMQQASIILGIEDGLSKKNIHKFRRFIHEQAGPEGLYYDDDQTMHGESDLKKVTFQIKDSLEELAEHVKAVNPGQEGSVNHSDLNTKIIEEQLAKLKERQDKHSRNVQKQLRTITEVLQALLTTQTGGLLDNRPGNQGVGVASAHPGVSVDVPRSRTIGRDYDAEEEGSYELLKRPRFVGRHLPRISSPVPRSSSPGLLDNTLATQRTFLDDSTLQATIPTNDGAVLEEHDRERLKNLRQDQKNRLKQRQQQEDYLQLQQSQSEVPVTSEVAQVQAVVDEDHDSRRGITRQITRHGGEEELADLVKFRRDDEDVERQGVSNEDDSLGSSSTARV